MRMLIIIFLAFSIATSAQQKKKSGPLVIKAAKVGFGWQVGKRAGNDAYDVVKDRVKKEIKKRKNHVSQ